MSRIRFLLIVALVIAAATANAYGGIAVTPDRHMVELSSGETKTVEYQVYNSGPEDIDIKLEPENWTDVKPYKRLAVDSWLFLEDKSLSVKVGETRPFKVTVKTPDGVEGELLAMIFLNYKEDKGSMVNIRNGNPLYLILKGTEQYGAQIESVNVSYRKDITGKGDYANIEIDVKNTGNVHIAPDIKMLLKDANGEIVKEMGTGDPKIILRGQQYTFVVKWEYPDELEEGKYSLIVNLAYEDKIKDASRTVEFEFKDETITMLGQNMGQ